MDNRRIENIGIDVAEGLVAHPGIAGGAIRVLKHTATWRHRSKVQQVKQVRRIIYEQIETKDEAMLSAALNISPKNDKNDEFDLQPPYDEFDIQIERKHWGTGQRALFLKNAARIFALYLRSRTNRWIFWRGAKDDFRAYFSLHAIESMNMLSSETLNNNLLELLRKLHHGWTMLSGNPIITRSRLPHDMHLKSTLCSAMKYLSEAIKITENDLHHQASSQYFDQICKASESIHLDDVPNFILRALSYYWVDPVVDFYDFSDESWDNSYQNDTLLQAILYLYTTKIAKIIPEDKIHFDKDKCPTINNLINGIEYKLRKLNIKKDTDEYRLGIINELERIKIYHGITCGYYARYYPDGEEGTQYIDILTHFANHYHHNTTMSRISNLLRKALKTGLAYSAQKYIYEISKKYGDHGLYIDSDIQFEKMLETSIKSLNDLSSTMKDFYGWIKDNHNNEFKNHSSDVYLQENMDAVQKISDTQISSHVKMITDNNDIILKGLQENKEMIQAINKSDEYEKARQIVNNLFRINHICSNNYDPHIVSISNSMQSSTSQKPHEEIQIHSPWIELLISTIDTFECHSTIITMFVCIYDALSKEDKNLSDEQHNLEKLNNNPERLEVIYNERSDLIKSKVEIFTTLNKKNNYLFHDSHIKQSLTLFSKQMQKSLHGAKTPVTLLFNNNNNKIRYKQSVQDAYHNINSLMR